jgi:hypothetical protein
MSRRLIFRLVSYRTSASLEGSVLNIPHVENLVELGKRQLYEKLGASVKPNRLVSVGNRDKISKLLRS